MDLFWAIYVYIVGAIFGSFFNVVGLRVPKNESIVRPRSHCTNCKQQLSALELIPIFSYLLLRGKCRNCKVKISPIYFYIEFFTGLLFAFAYYFYGFTSELLVALFFISLLMIIFVSDIHYMIIPDKILLFFAPILLVIRLTIAPLSPWWDSFLGAIVGFVLLLIIAIVSRGGMGGGDIKLFAVIGIVVGWKGVLLTLIFACLFGTIIAGTMLLIGHLKRGEPIPFGPYITIGALITYFYGNEILHWYLQWF